MCFDLLLGAIIFFLMDFYFKGGVCTPTPMRALEVTSAVSKLKQLIADAEAMCKESLLPELVHWPQICNIKQHRKPKGGVVAFAVKRCISGRHVVPTSNIPKSIELKHASFVISPLPI